MTIRPCRRLVALATVMLVAVTVPAAPQPPKAGSSTPKTGNLNEVSMEIAALQTLHELELTPDQLSALAKLARESASKDEKRQPAKTSPEFATALNNLRAAYVKGDDNQIGECQEKLDGMMEKQQPELDNGVVITEGGRAHAPEALKLLNVRQVGTFLGTLEVTDPVELLVSAIEQVRDIKKSDEAEREIATVAEEVAWLLNGWDDDDASQKTQAKVTTLLQGAAKHKGAAGASDRKHWEKDAREAVGDVDYKEVIAHIVEHGMAELLSNPRLDAAIRVQTRIASKPPSTKTAAPPSKKAPKD
jgi:hypothetical protein